MTLSQKQNQNFTAIVWHRGGVTCMSKMGLLNRPGHAVSSFGGVRLADWGQNLVVFV